MPETTVASFVVRFVQEDGAVDADPAASWHGIIRHVQSSKERRFTQIEDALAFIGGYVDLGDVPVGIPQEESPRG